MRTNHAQEKSDNDTYIVLFEAAYVGCFRPQVLVFPFFRHFRFCMVRNKFVDLLLRKFLLENIRTTSNFSVNRVRAVRDDCEVIESASNSQSSGDAEIN